MSNYLPAKTLTSRQEGFCIDVAFGKTQTDAYINNYTTENMSREMIWTEASKLAHNPKVSLRIKELKEKEVKAKILSASQIAARLSELAMADLSSFVDENGDIRHPSDLIPGHQALQSYSRYTGTNKDGLPYERKSLKLVSPIDALTELNRMQGNHAPSKSVNLNMNWDVEMVERPIPADRQADFTDEPE